MVATAQCLASAINFGKGISDLSAGAVYDVYAVPTSFTISVSSNAAAGGTNTKIWLFNNSAMNPAVSDNGSGGGVSSIFYAYGDGFKGNIYTRYLNGYNAGTGILIKGFTIIATNFTTGAALPGSVLNGLNLNLISANGQGSVLPEVIDLSEAIRNTQYISGMQTVRSPFRFNALSQLQLSLPPNTTLAFTLFTEASGF